MKELEFTDDWLVTVTSGNDVQRDFRDKLNTTLKVRVGRGGTKTFFAQAMVSGDRRFEVFGHYPEVSIEQARSLATKQATDWTKLRKGTVPGMAPAQPKPLGTLSQYVETHIKTANAKRRRDGRPEMRSESQLRDSLKYHFPDEFDESIVCINAELVLERYHDEIPARTLSTLRTVLKPAVKLGRISDPHVLLPEGWAQGQKTPLLSELRKRPERIADVLIAARNYPTSIEQRVFGEMLLFTGRRPGELRKLEWEHVELQSDRACYWVGQHKTQRTVDDFLAAPLSEHLVALLTAWKVTRDANPTDDDRDFYVFPASQIETEEPWMSVSGYRNMVDYIATECDLPGFTAKQFRKFFVSVSDSMGIPTNTANLLTGHAIPGARGHYSFPLIAAMREPLEKITTKILEYARPK
jgi:integrase